MSQKKNKLPVQKTLKFTLNALNLDTPIDVLSANLNKKINTKINYLLMIIIFGCAQKIKRSFLGIL